MAYVKTNWQTGDVITAAKLNNMETGIYDATEAAADAFVADIDDPQDGDVIKYDSTAEKWVNGAAGGGSASLVTNGTLDATDPQAITVTLDKTASEIYTAFSGGSPVFAKLGPLPVLGDMLVFQMIYCSYNASLSSGNYVFKFYDGTQLYEFFANAGTDYPVADYS